MKNKIIKVMLISFLLSIILCSNISLASNSIEVQNEVEIEDSNIEEKIVEIKEITTETLEDYKIKYDSEVNGTIAYILNLIRIYSIPVCFLGIAIGAIHKYIIGLRKLDTIEKGMGLIVTFITILIISQILPLIFVVFVKFGKG